ncbi:MAG: KH domain-containing protein [Patescibacteria group bacterium]|nr:KH domain-containing protein [Patescibacteria group bacterium]
MAEKDQEFVEYVVKAIVEAPDKVKVDRKIDERGVLLELTVDPSDMGKIIGKDGRTAKAVRTLLRVLGAQNDARVNLKIIEPEGGLGPRVRDESASEAPAEEETSADMPETTTSADLDDLKEE